VEIFVALELLADQRGADDFAILLDQAALGLARKDDFGDAGHGQRVGEAGDERERDKNNDGGPDFAQHDCFSSSQMQGGDDDVDRLDADEWNDHAADAIDHKIAQQ
jgi:hypothetical protein